jgi:hypothetical protein
VQVKKTFEAKHVIRVCSSEYKEHALAAARKLIAEADRIKAQVDLRGASIALDECYQVIVPWRIYMCSSPNQCRVWLLKSCVASPPPACDLSSILIPASHLVMKQTLDNHCLTHDCEVMLQVWESGFISIPFSFDVADLHPKLAQLMPGAPEDDAAVTRNCGAATEPRGHGSPASNGNGARLANRAPDLAANATIRAAGCSVDQAGEWHGHEHVNADAGMHDLQARLACFNASGAVFGNAAVWATQSLDDLEAQARRSPNRFDSGTVHHGAAGGCAHSSGRLGGRGASLARPGYQRVCAVRVRGVLHDVRFVPGTVRQPRTCYRLVL